MSGEKLIQTEPAGGLLVVIVHIDKDKDSVHTKKQTWITF